MKTKNCDMAKLFMPSACVCCHFSALRLILIINMQYWLPEVLQINLYLLDENLCRL